MSGVAKGIAGPALSAVSVAALFTTCIECFDIVVARKNFSEEYEQLCTLFSLQRARFGLWGESVGLIPSPVSGSRLRYDNSIDRPDIRPGVERILLNIKSLLEEAGRMDKRYGLEANVSRGCEISTSKGIDVFKVSFGRSKSRVRKHQKDTSAWKVTRWAIHDANKFEGMIDRLENFVDGLESITKSLGLLEQQHSRLQTEIERISDVQSLRLLRNASSSRQSSQRNVSDIASRRLAVVESMVEQRAMTATSIFAGTNDSFFAANIRPSTTTESLQSDYLMIPGAWLKSNKFGSKGRHS